jgi:subtilisin-like proprotein convertase family protein
LTALSAAATSGAVFAVIAASTGSDDRTVLPGTEFIGIPLVEVGRTSGDTLRAGIVASSGVRAHLELRSAEWTFSVTNALLLEHVRLTLNWQHPRVRDLRVTLESPSGTISILHRPGGSAHAVPSTWTYGSAMHFGESSQGVWKVAVTDESPGEIGSVGSLSLTLHGVPIVDADADGLDDAWELKHFGNLSQGPSGDPDLDGWTNLQEQLAGSDPTADDAPLRVEVMPMPDGRLRLSWPGRSGVTYRVEMAADLGQAWTEVQSLAGRFPETGWMAPAEVSKGYFRIRQTP